ncbi:TPA: hypothetical protein RPW15_000176 [Campylobacter fetus subsp. venerealis]|nr:hypothetical protein [Campylobacter fetus]OCS23442.1 conjugal transfer protein [Campylobacter fetus subsp. venerealis cfvi9825]HDX6281768.1 hypothetical protein [Campylobacter fetus subsp. venerealis]HDX6283893.1 hypothetical protein [Campylobacter fetus subsp. venerealis]HDX6285995.1 hypothetical protein [Campylobacter fetus subsp. venerealis]HDX6287887.1 hypothetical protein [Campylobacter fetus subsp. venerealis]
MKIFNELDLIPGYGYEIDPELAEELGAFKEDAILEYDIKEAIEDES